MTSHSFSIRTEADVLAMIPFTLGFHPEDSLVLITLGSTSGPFHARIDLPEDVQELPGIVDPLVHAAVANDGDHAMVVAYTDDECLADAAVGLLVRRLELVDISTLLELRADGQRWYPLGLDTLDLRSIQGVPYDVRTHELTSRAVLEGKVTFRNRNELADSLTPVDPDTVDEVSTAHVALGPLDRADPVLVAEARWAVEVTRAGVHGGDPFDPRTAARMLRALTEREVRDLVWCEISRLDAEAHVRLWRELVRRSPAPLAAPAAGLLAFSAWLAGDGALAWCAVDRALSADPDHTLGQLVAQALEAALPPSSWEPPDPASCRLYAG